MNQPHIEHSGQPGRYTREELEQKVRESRAFWTSAKGRALKEERDLEQRKQRSKGIKFPDLAKSNGTAPSMSDPLKIRARLLGKI